jgi:hypothetical protein
MFFAEGETKFRSQTEIRYKTVVLYILISTEDGKRKDVPYYELKGSQHNPLVFATAALTCYCEGSRCSETILGL